MPLACFPSADTCPKVCVRVFFLGGGLGRETDGGKEGPFHGKRILTKRKQHSRPLPHRRATLEGLGLKVQGSRRRI